MIHNPTLTSVDGIRLNRFQRGRQYDVGHGLASFLIAAGWAELAVHDDQVQSVPEPPVERRKNPPNLIRELFPPYLDRLPPHLAAAFDRRRRRDS